MFDENIKLYVAKVINGDIAALEKLYGLTYNRIYFIIYQMVRNREDAQDLLQDTYIQAFSKIKDIRNTESFYAWLIKIAVNLSKNHIKRNKTVIINNESDEFFDSIIDDNQINISEHIENSETRDIIFKMLDILPPEQKRAVLLFYYENMSVSEIARIDETLVSTITSRLSYARISLKKAVLAYEKKKHIRLHSGSLALALYTAICVPTAGILLDTAAAVETFVAVMNALGFGSVMSEGVKFISSVNYNGEDTIGLREKIRHFMRKRYIFEVKPIFAAAAAFTVIFLALFILVTGRTPAKTILADITSSTISPISAESESNNTEIVSSASAPAADVAVNSFAKLKNAIYSGVEIINIDGVITAESLIMISSTTTITGGEITRYDKADGSFYDGVIFNVSSSDSEDVVLTLKNVTMDGCCYDEAADDYIRNASNIIEVRNGSSLILDGTVIKNNNAEAENNAAIYSFKAEMIEIRGGSQINNCRSSSNGGAIIVNESKISIKEGSVFTQNISKKSGGGVALYAGCTLDIDNASFIGNKSLGDICGGGAVATSGISNINIKDSIFKYNEAYFVGGAIGGCDGTEFYIEGSIFETNYCEKEGGGAIYIDKCELNIDKGSSFMLNYSDNVGGAFLSNGSRIILNDSKISDNNAKIGGGMFFCNGSTFTMNGGSIVNNFSYTDGGGIALDGNGGVCTATINGGRIAENTAQSGGDIMNHNSSLIINGGDIYDN